MRSVFLGRMLFVVILSWAACFVSGGAGAAAQVDVQAVRQKAEQGDAAAQFNLGLMYANGKGVKQDYAQARQWFQKAAEQGDAAAQFILGVMYYEGKWVKQDYGQARQWFQKAVDQGLAGVQQVFIDHGMDRNEALIAFASMQYLLGVMYGNGYGVKQDYAQARQWYQKAAEQGNAEAQFNLGVMYANGYGVKQDYAQARQWFQKAADQGLANAQFNLGVMYDEGQGVKQDYSQARQWYQKAAEQGEADAQSNLGMMYSEGKGVKQDYSQAIQWYQKAAEQGHANAQHNLGVMYIDGRGVKQDYGQARQWSQKAAEQGHTGAQFNLGKMYAEGKGGKQDYGQARQWYQKAAEQGYAGAQEALDKLNNGQTATPSKENTGASNEDNALAQAGIPPIPSRDDVWVSVGKFYKEEVGYFEFYVAPSTIVRTGKPNGFKIWLKSNASIAFGPATVYQYIQFDCDKRASRGLASKGKDLTGETFEIKTDLWSPADDETGAFITFSKIILNYCN
ncbi:MAG: SEL1-like repeat protein [Candidatus Contendobacter sp.]|nr:SEL1-like repeat protein [Candidatus Contendobacter sp.]